MPNASEVGRSVTVPGVGLGVGVGVGVAVGVGVGVGVAVFVGVGVGVAVGVGVGVAPPPINWFSTFAVICCAAGLTRDELGPLGAISASPQAH